MLNGNHLSRYTHTESIFYELSASLVPCSGHGGGGAHPPVRTVGGSTHVVGPQGHAAPAARAELGAAVGAQVAAAIGELGLVADAAGRSIVFVLTLVTPCFFPYFSHLFLIAFELLMQSPGQKRKWEQLRECWKREQKHFFVAEETSSFWTEAKHTKPLSPLTLPTEVRNVLACLPLVAIVLISTEPYINRLYIIIPYNFPTVEFLYPLRASASLTGDFQSIFDWYSTSYNHNHVYIRQTLYKILSLTL